MSASIRTTIATALSTAGINPDSYASHIDTVATALEEREFTITETIVEETSRQFDVPAAVVAEQIKAKTALEFRPIPEPVVEIAVEETVVEDDSEDAEGAAKPGGKSERISKLEDSVEELVGAVAKLTALAERHLGGMN